MISIHKMVMSIKLTIMWARTKSCVPRPFPNRSDRKDFSDSLQCCTESCQYRTMSGAGDNRQESIVTCHWCPDTYFHPVPRAVPSEVSSDRTEKKKDSSGGDTKVAHSFDLQQINIFIYTLHYTRFK